MSINGVQLPIKADNNSLSSAVLDIRRRAIDGTVVPLFIDYANQRVIVGAIATANSNAKVQVNGGDIEVIGSTNGIILTDSGGSGHTCRVRATFDAASGDWILSLDTVS